MQLMQGLQGIKTGNKNSGGAFISKENGNFNKLLRKLLSNLCLVYY